MIEININKRFNIKELNIYLFSFKTKYQFAKEFSLRIIKEKIICFSEIYLKYFIIN